LGGRSQEAGTAFHLVPFQKPVKAALENSVPCGPPPSPTATQSFADRQLTELNALVPPLAGAGTLATFQVVPLYEAASAWLVSSVPSALVPPTVTHLVGEVHDTPPSSGFLGPPAPKTLVTDQVLPFHRSANAVAKGAPTETVDLKFVPTATQSVADTHDTLVKEGADAPAGVAAFCTLNALPFHDSNSTATFLAL